MFCSECGKQVEDNAKFCASCGAKQIEQPFELPEGIQTKDNYTNRTQPSNNHYNAPPSHATKVESNSNITIDVNKKSKLAAFLLVLFFGPIGLFYASVKGGVIMCLLIVLTWILVFGGLYGLFSGSQAGAAAGIGLAIILSFIIYIGSIIWAVISTRQS